MRTASAVLLASVLAATSAAAKAPEPKKPVDLDRMMGRWYEIAHTPNPRQKPCVGGTMDWARKGEGLSVVQRCELPGGKARTWGGTARVIDPKTNAKIQLSLLGGVVKQQYWVLDRADDYGWVAVGTDGGNYVWLLSKTPTLTGAARQQALGRVKALGYDTANLKVHDQAG